MEQSHNPLCQAARSRLDALSQSSDNSFLSVEGLETSVYLDEGHARRFDGDLFGDAQAYHRDNFGQLDGHSDDSNTEHLDLDVQLDPPAGLKHDIDSVELHLFELELENSWEPNRETNISQGLGSLESNDNVENLHDIHLAQQRLSAEERADSHPQIIRYSDRYLSSRAGFISSSGVSSDSTYTTLVEGQSNLWALFASEIDWKVARWGKLHSAGSTAFSDLLAIEGVRFSSLSSFFRSF
jgi:hypothetical protein